MDTQILNRKYYSIRLFLYVLLKVTLFNISNRSRERKILQSFLRGFI